MECPCGHVRLNSKGYTLVAHLLHYQNLAPNVAKFLEEWVSFCIGVLANPGGLVSQHQQESKLEPCCKYKQLGGWAGVVGNLVVLNPTPTTVH